MAAVSAAHLVDKKPCVPVRQWVVSFPKRLRYFLHRDSSLINRVNRIAVELIEHLLTRSAQAPETARIGAVLFLHRRVVLFGERPRRIFRQAATKYLNEGTKATLDDDGRLLKHLDSYIGDLELKQVHMGSLLPYISKRKKEGVKNRTINAGLQVVRHILNLAADEWMDESGKTWLDKAPKIKLLRETDRRRPYRLSWDEQARLFKELPAHLARMALFKVNTGCRDSEVCGLRWEWEVQVPEMGASIFMIPGDRVKNREDRIVVLNRVARSVIEELRGEHDTYVFTHKDSPLRSINNSGWKSARIRAGLRQVRVHDLKHTFGRRLRAAGVSFEDRQDLLGHKSGRITTHYSEAEIGNLIKAADLIFSQDMQNSRTGGVETKWGIAKDRYLIVFYMTFLVGRAGIEPATR
ncbi:MAG: integrase [Acidiferrobacteraceae bacterium]|nr:integrase [Acidiferrobacteraceae bacterium]